MTPWLIGLTSLAMLVGFAAGFVTFKRSLRWCPDCGATLGCTECGRHRAVLRLSAGARSPGRWAHR